MALIAVILKVGDLSLPEEKWRVDLGSTADLSWLLESLVNKAEFTKLSLKKKKGKKMSSIRRLRIR